LASRPWAGVPRWGCALLRAADVSFGYHDTPVLSGVSIHVPDGGLVGIIGPNGSGKTTLLRVLAGTRKPQRGVVTLDDQPLGTLPRAALARRMAVVPQETHLAFEYTVLEVVLMGRYPHLGPFAIEGPADVSIARQALASTGTLALEGREFSTLSGGEKQRVVIATALAQIGGRASGSILLLDEPTAALDLKYQLEIGALLESLHRSHALTVVVSTHDLNFAAALCDTLVMLKDGRVLASGRVADVLTPALVRQLYDVDADVTPHPRTGHLTVVPLRTSGGPSA
jgi:iron complex transport system ATP-binding protein